MTQLINLYLLNFLAKPLSNTKPIFFTMRKLSIFFVLFLLSPIVSLSQETPLEKGLNAITKSSVQAQLEFLASDWTEGRATGTKGEFLAADYLASMLQFMEVDPAGDKDWTQPTREQRWKGIKAEEFTTYFQNIYMIKQLESSSSLTISANNQDYSFTENVDYSLFGGNSSVRINADLVFVGYGYTSEETGYDDFKGVDVKNKIIIRLNGYPGHNDPSSLGYNRFHKEERYFEYYLDKNKDDVAKEKGVLAIIDIYPNLSPKNWIDKEDFNNLSQNESPKSPIYENRLELPSDNIDAKPLEIYPSNKLVIKLLKNQGINLEQFEEQAANSLKPNSKPLKNTKLKINYQVKTELLHTRNVLGVIEGENKDEIVVVGGHYDHLGAANGFVWSGADDNASGTVGVWMLAKAFKASGIKPKKTIVFAAWTGEEKGLLGSEYFADYPFGDKIENIKFYLNFDMISKDSENDTLKNKARMVYTSSFSELEAKTEENIKKYGLNLNMTYRPSVKPRGGSDHASFSAKNVPIMYFMAGFPVTYHTPKDKTDDINWDKMVNIIKLSYLNLWDIINED